MFRYQLHVHVRTAHWRDFQVLVDQLNAIAATKGLAQFQLWEAAFGRLNDALLIAEYDTLEALERERAALRADPTWMNLMRELMAHADGTPWTDLIWRPSEGA